MVTRRLFLKNGGLALVSLGFAPAFLARTAAASYPPGPPPMIATDCVRSKLRDMRPILPCPTRRTRVGPAVLALVRAHS